MEASKTISMRSFRLLLQLIIFGGLPFAFGRQIMTPEDSRMASNSSTYSSLGHLGKQVMKAKINYRVFINGNEYIHSANNVGSTPSSPPAVVAGSQETTASTSTKSNKDNLVKNWGPWVLLILLVSTGISVHCYCYRGFPQTSAALSVSPSISVSLTTAPICCCCNISS